MAEMTEAFPDSGDWIPAIAKSLAVNDIARLLRRMEYRHPPELLSMYLCLFGERTVVSWPSDLVVANTAKLCSLQRSMASDLGVVPVPARLLKACFA